MQEILTIVIIIAALIYIVKSAVGVFRDNSKKCGCGCDKCPYKCREKEDKS